MYIKIYFDNKPLFLCDSIDDTIQPYVHHDDAVFIDELNSPSLNSMIHEMLQPQVKAGIYFNPDLEVLKKEFFKKFNLVKAAGGFILNEEDKLLMMFRRAKWDLPKGKVDKNESLEKCAIRETQEETGLTNIQLISPLMNTYHTYHEGSRFILKETSWFRMRVKGNQILIPQAEENIERLEWVTRSGVKKYLNNSFPSVEDVIKQGFTTAF